MKLHPCIRLSLTMCLCICLTACLMTERKMKIYEPTAHLPSYDPFALQTNQARYDPGEEVVFSLSLDNISSYFGAKLIVQYKKNNQVLNHQQIALNEHGKTEWSWLTPRDEQGGYLAEVYILQEEEILAFYTIAVDVSLSWEQFPRYGYLADFNAMSADKQLSVIQKLNRYHINGIQFYDWQYKHHQPLLFENGQMAAEWPDIANRKVSLATLETYIDLAHQYNMMTMNYNLLFGAYEYADDDGVKKEWGLYKNMLMANQDHHPLPDSWASDIYLYNPSNTEWQQYLIKQEEQVFEQLGFDGWHIDQLGDRGNLYTAKGQKVNLAESYQSFLQYAQQNLNVSYVMNAVNQFAQPYIAQTDVAFLYTEVWDSYPQYGNLKSIIDQNEKYAKGEKQTVLAAYVNYNHANYAGEFNLPGVLYTEAVIIASGGAHLALGENMLAKEYFPNRNLKVSGELANRLVHYYDFMTAYQHLLRMNLAGSTILPHSEEIEITERPTKGKVWSFSKQADSKTVVHLINFNGAKHLLWNDTDATQTAPQHYEQLSIEIEVDNEVSEVWYASPDYLQATSQSLKFEQAEGKITTYIPYLEYYGMLVMEYK